MHKRQRLSTEKRALDGARRPSVRTATCLRTARIARKDVNFEAPFGGLGSFSCKRSFFLQEYLLRAMFSVVNKDGAINLRDGRTLLTCPFFAGWTSSLQKGNGGWTGRRLEEAVSASEDLAHFRNVLLVLKVSFWSQEKI